MIPEGKDVDAVTPEIEAEVIRRVLNYKKEKRTLTQGQIARDVGIAETTLSQVLGGKYPADTRQMILDLDRWLDEKLKIDLAPKPASFVWTSVAREIESCAKVAVELKTIALVYGPETSGLGKTTALRAIAAERPGCIFVTVDKVAANTSGLLEQIARHLGIGQQHSHAWTFERIVDKLRGTRRLLIVDQIHDLCGARKDKPFYVLAQLHERCKPAPDEGGLPMLWAGTSDVKGYLRRGQKKGEESLCQVTSRIGLQRDLTQRLRHTGGVGDGAGGDGQLFTIAEIREIFAKNKMRLSADGARYLLRLANLPDSGALRTCKNLVVMATMLYQDNHQLLTEEILRAAHRMLLTDESFQLLQAEIEQGGSGLRAAKVG